MCDLSSYTHACVTSVRCFIHAAHLGILDYGYKQLVHTAPEHERARLAVNRLAHAEINIVRVCCRTYYGFDQIKNFVDVARALPANAFHSQSFLHGRGS